MLRGRVQDGVRPTSARVREALFSMIGQDLADQRVLDAFGGSGLLGLEAWSRGADVVVCERRPRVARAIRDAAAELGATVQVIVGDVLAQVATLGSVDGVLADPPYAMEPGPILDALAQLQPAWMVFEADAARAAPPAAGGLMLDRTRTFGSSSLWIYREPA